ncbi:hypothetical protein [Hamadaea tsunoensis]|uniref:hypothetical protein n=1 Tax=Hamadaea tsunoensis TaxID=53368 RepID=UPI0003FDF1D0|nr:hypothetical protein [Hamadaea tsunoensis]
MRRLLTVLAAVALAACSSPAPAPPAGPDALTRMVCEQEVREELAAALGVDAQPQGTWTPPTYTCVYAYPDGRFTLTIRELPDKAAATAYYEERRNAATARTELPGIGEAAFSVADGSIYLRKDAKVLYADVSALPDKFGNPPITKVRAALSIVTTVMHCWTENS